MSKKKKCIKNVASGEMALNFAPGKSWQKRKKTASKELDSPMQPGKIEWDKRSESLSPHHFK